MWRIEFRAPALVRTVRRLEAQLGGAEMTDLERWREFLTSFGIVFEENGGVSDKNGGLATELDIRDDGGEKNTGYIGFYTSVEFDEDRKFVQIGAWE